MKKHQNDLGGFMFPDNVVRMPYALRCENCNRVKFQPFSQDAWLVTDDTCTMCNGKGTAPIPPAELGL